LEHLHIALAGLAVVAGAMTVLWLLSLRLRDVSIVDPFWAPGFLLASATYLAFAPERGIRGWLVTLLVGIWAARLGSHLLRRNLRSGEDPRYGSMRAGGGARFPWVSLVTVFWLQAALLWLVSAPLLAAVTSTLPLGALDVAGALCMLTGIVLEAVADRQLERFKADPENRGQVLDSGLWRYSRHPNYFGNAVMWWGAWLIAVAGGGAWTVFGPAIMTFLLLRVSGVTLLERDIGERRPAYADYVRRTSAFVPWPPKSTG
jgi:steroid 5-alpha reductase family enzyme